MTTMFRAHLQSGLSKLPFPTGSGRVVQGRPSFPQMGYPGGTHHNVSVIWRYRPNHRCMTTPDLCHHGEFPQEIKISPELIGRVKKKFGSVLAGS